MIVYIIALQNSMRELLEMILPSVIWLDARSTQQSVVLLYKNDKGAEKEIRETSPFTTATNNMKYLGGNTNQRSEMPACLSP